MRADASINKFHYHSTMKDISRVVQGLISNDIGNFEDLDLLWIHECSRIFVDKLSSHSDKAWATELLEKTADVSLKSIVTMNKKIRLYNFYRFCSDLNRRRQMHYLFVSQILFRTQRTAPAW